MTTIKYAVNSANDQYVKYPCSFFFRSLITLSLKKESSFCFSKLLLTLKNFVVIMYGISELTQFILHYVEYIDSLPFHNFGRFETYLFHIWPFQNLVWFRNGLAILVPY